MGDALEVPPEVGPGIGGRCRELADDAREARVELMPLEPGPAGRIVMELVDLRRHAGALKRAQGREADRRPETGRADPLFALLQEVEHRTLRNRRTRQCPRMPALGNPVRLVDELPCVDCVTMTGGHAEEGIERTGEEPCALGRIANRVGAPLLFDPRRIRAGYAAG